MASIAPDYEYDIFISYRQKDNKYDGWVTEFVQNLKKELEATFKEDISIYFDENLHDGLLETHDVDDSLKGKLKCLIFIPIISQTYCDPKSFAWSNEFLAFKKLTSEDQLGLKVKLVNGNVTSRILPVRIHELDASDKILFENEVGQLRSIDFIFKSPGVNRPLRANEDHPNDNLNKTYYRDQVNKVANAIKDIFTSIKFNATAHRPGLNTQTKRSSIEFNRHGKKLWVAFAVIFSLMILSVVGYYFFRDINNGSEEKRIAVLAFADMSANKDQEWFAEGLSEELINMLTKVPNLKVTARTSAFAFKGKNEDIRTIASKLKVDYVLEGSVRESEDRYKVTAQLIEAKEGLHVWSETIEISKGDILKLHEEIANSVVKVLRITLLKKIDYGERQSNQDALNQYLQGRYNNLHHKVDKAIHNYKAAIHIDSMYTKAWAGLAWTYTIMSPSDSLSSIEILQRRRFYAQKAYSINPNEPEAIRAMIQLYDGEGEFEKVKEMAKRGMELQPNNVDILMFASYPLFHEHRFDEAITLLKRAVDIDPLNYLPHAFLSYLYLIEGRIEEYRYELQTGFELGKDVPGMFQNMSELALIDGDIQSALEYLNKIDYSENPWSKIYSFVPMYLAGRDQDAEEILKWAEAEQADYFPVEIAICYVFKNDFDRAFQYLERAADSNDSRVKHIRGNYYFGKHFRADLRYKAFLKRLNLPDKEIKWSLYDHLKGTGKYKLK